MITDLKCIAVGFVLLSATSRAEVTIPEQLQYPLPADVRQSLTTLASECNVLVFGETHGTQEVPAIAEGLLGELSKLGFRALALEVPHNEQPAIAAWGTGATDVVPMFFASPGQDGRGNQQVLALIRHALRPPYAWRLICFDATEEELLRQTTAHLPKGTKESIAELAAKLSIEEVVALSVQRDATMAKYFAAERKKLPTHDKVLVVCGNMHARTANHASAESPIRALWPLFAAVLRRDYPHWQLRSINVQAFSGEYFNGGKVNKFRERPLAKVEMRLTEGSDWDWELNLPRATVATFFKSPD